MAAACGGAQSEGSNPGQAAHRSQADGANGARGAGRGLHAARLGKLPAGTYGPYLGERADGRIMIWAAPAPKQGRAWYSLPVSSEGSRPAKPLKIADAPAEIGLVAVRPAGGGKPGSELAAPGYVTMITDVGVGHAVKALALGPRGELRGGPTLLADADGRVLWVEAIETDSGALSLWAVQRDDRAEIRVAQLGPAGQLMGEPTTLLTDARAWQAVKVSGGAAVAAVNAGVKAGDSGPLRVFFIDSTGAKVGAPVTVSSEPTAGLDLDIASVGSGLVVAWSDRRQIEPKIHVAALDARGKLRLPPTRVTQAIGEETLVRVVPPFDAGSSAYLAWEGPSERADAGRTIHLAAVAQDGAVSKTRATLELHSDDSVPEFRSTASGLAALTLAPACPREGKCEKPPIVPTYVQFDRQLEVVASEPMRLDLLDGAAPTLAWGLSCAKSGCLTLAAVESSPAPVFAVRLESDAGAWRPAARHVPREAPPRAVGLEAIAELDPVHDVSVLPVGDSALVAWVTYFDPTTPYVRLKRPAPDGRLDPLRALLQVQAASGDAGELGPIETVSLRARSLAGVSLAPGRPGQNEALLVWSAIDNKQPQVFLTLLDARGKKKQQKMLTHNRGEVNDVAAVNVGDGWLVGWVDERSGDPEVYVTRIDQRLQRRSPEQRLTEAAGSATDVVMRSEDDHTQVFWADARDSARPGFADIYTVRVRNQDGKPEGEPRPLAKTEPHSFAPVLDRYGPGLVLAWLEAGSAAKSDQTRSGVMLAQLDASGHVESPPALVETSGGKPTSLALDCHELQCRFVVSVETQHGCQLQGFVWTAGAKPKAKKLASLVGPAGQAVAPGLSGRQLFFADRTPEGQGRVHRMLVDWSE